MTATLLLSPPRVGVTPLLTKKVMPFHSDCVTLAALGAGNAATLQALAVKQSHAVLSAALVVVVAPRQKAEPLVDTLTLTIWLRLAASKRAWFQKLTTCS